MAIIKLGGGVASASGSIGGTTFSHNRGGPYMRTRAVPTNPNTTQQQQVRNAVAQLTARWRDTLTAAQRTGWETYAENVPLPNPLGEMRNVGGLGMYVRSNTPRLMIAITGISILDSAPTTYNLGEVTAPTLGTLSESGGTIALNFEDTDDWCGEDGSIMFMYSSRDQNPSINYFRGPYRRGQSVEGDATTPPTSPASLLAAFPIVEGNKTFVRVNVSRADGRLSTPFFLVGTGSS